MWKHESFRRTSTVSRRSAGARQGTRCLLRSAGKATEVRSQESSSMVWPTRSNTGAWQPVSASKTLRFLILPPKVPDQLPRPHDAVGQPPPLREEDADLPDSLPARDSPSTNCRRHVAPRPGVDRERGLRRQGSGIPLPSGFPGLQQQHASPLRQPVGLRQRNARPRWPLVSRFKPSSTTTQAWHPGGSVHRQSFLSNLRDARTLTLWCHWHNRGDSTSLDLSSERRCYTASLAQDTVLLLPCPPPLLRPRGCVSMRGGPEPPTQRVCAHFSKEPTSRPPTQRKERHGSSSLDHSPPRQFRPLRRRVGAAWRRLDGASLGLRGDFTPAHRRRPPRTWRTASCSRRHVTTRPTSETQKEKLTRDRVESATVTSQHCWCRRVAS